MADPGHDTSFDEAADSALGRMAGLAASIVDAPIASIALHADGGLWCTSTDDLDDARKLHRTSLCAHMSEAGRPLVVADASIDERFRADPAVASPPQIRFYAGIPLTTTDGRHLGSLNIADVRPRTALDTADMQKLQDLATLIVDRIRCSQERKRALRLPPVSPAVLAAMSHDIRTPMNGVLGMAEVLLTADDLSDRNRRRIDIIKRSGEQLLSMLDGIIELSRIESEETTPQTARFDLVEIVQDVLAQVGLPASGQEIRFDPPGDRLQVAGDAARLKRLLLRFLESATGFASERDIKMDVSVRSMGEGRVRTRFEIGNANIDGDELGRIFTAVEQGDLRELDGFGEACLGPVICRKLAAEMGGVLGVERPAGSSPVLWLECDLDASATSAAATVGTPEEAPGRRGCRPDESHPRRSHRRRQSGHGPSDRRSAG